jgi:hypothetical protein
MEQCHLFLHFGYKRGALTEPHNVVLNVVSINRALLRSCAISVCYLWVETECFYGLFPLTSKRFNRGNGMN